jgi:4-aminobutyrate aminotransferase-like enzyme/Ser/Thr protein kinase RdoA (MazF antagonist)
LKQANEPLSEKQAEHILFKCYSISGAASKLAGEIDFNYRIEINSKPSYILKISNQNADLNYLDFQDQLLNFLQNSQIDNNSPRLIKDQNGTAVSNYKDESGTRFYVRLLTWIPGRLWSCVNPQLDDMRFSLGLICGQLTNSLMGFDHPQAHRTFDWDIANSLWTKNHLNVFEKEQRELVAYFQNLFESKKESYEQLRKSIVHNDANDNNIIVSNDLLNPKVEALIDYGDAIYTQIINDLAVSCTYAIMHHNDPLEAALPIVKGYHHSSPLLEKELEHLYSSIGMRLVISVTQSAINKTKHPENIYLQISEKPAWELLKKWKNINEEFALFSFRHACGYHPHPDEDKFKTFAKNQDFSVKDLFPSLGRHELKHIDLSVSSSWIGHPSEYNDLDLFQFKIEQLQKTCPDQILAGGYLEPRSIYGTASYNKIGNSGPETRSIHLGVDFWLPAYTPVHALFDGKVITAVNDAGNKEYGGLLILKHRVEDFCFYSLYGHNTVDSVSRYKVGDQVRKGDLITELGNYPENGNWAPHLHFQLMLSMLDYQIDFPGVMYPKQMEIWESLCPDPNLLFKSKALEQSKFQSNDDLIQFRQQHLGKGLSLQYREPLKIVRGSGAHLIDQNGRFYLDTVNNVAHVGHEHYKVVKAGQEQMGLLNTNTRYLHQNINRLTEELLKTLPEKLSVVHYVNSGSEANELAIRMAKTFTGQKDIIASQVGYHGNTNLCVDISSYKFDGIGGNGAPKHTHIFPLPDTFRGIYRGPTAANDYVEEVKKCIDQIKNQNRGVCAMIIEPIISCGGQIELPQGFLENAYQHVRQAGGVCISDEVQVGCGRIGSTFWGFEHYNVIPDIITIGKPLGNGHPVAAVVCTKEIAEAFANGMEYFNTFGGNPVSCAIATQVLKTIQEEQLQTNALKVGGFLKEELVLLSKEFSIIGEVRGQGLFLGIELVDQDLNPLASQTSYLVNRMKDHGILMSVDGPDHNVLKIKPPMVFSKENAKELLYYLRQVFKENYMELEPHKG